MGLLGLLPLPVLGGENVNKAQLGCILKPVEKTENNGSWDLTHHIIMEIYIWPKSIGALNDKDKARCSVLVRGG